MKLLFEKRIQLYKRFLKEDSLTDLDRLGLENKKEWQIAHLLGLIEHDSFAAEQFSITSGTSIA
jgi:hypothetical protein